MCSSGIVGQFRDCDVVAVADFEIILLDTDHKDEGVGVFGAVAIPETDEEGHPVEIETIVEIVESALILIDEVGGDDRGAETEGRGAAFFFRDIDKTTGVDGEFHRDTVFAVEALVGLAEVSGRDADIPCVAIGHRTSAEVGEPFGGLVGHLSARGVDEAVVGVDHIAETEIVGVPIDTAIADRGLETCIDKDFPADLEAEGVDDTEEAIAQDAVVALTVVEDDGADAAVEFGDVLVVGEGDRLIGAHEARPLVAVGQREARSHLRTCKRWVHVERVGVELGETDVLGLHTMCNEERGEAEEGYFFQLFHRVFGMHTKPKMDWQYYDFFVT